MWNKKFEKSDRKKFLHLIDYIVEAIDSGELAPGQSLPTQRELSRKLNLSIGTITKAFSELEKMGYLSGEIGRGTFVRDIAAEYDDFWYTESKVPYKYNLGHYRTTELFNNTIRVNLLSGIKEVANGPDLFKHLNDLNNFGSSAQRETFIHWLGNIGFESISTNQISLLAAELLSTNVLINTLSERGDHVILEEVGDRITKEQVVQSDRKVVTVKMDQEGIIPESLEEAIVRHQAKLLVTTCTFHNPTAIITPLKRKKEVLRICEKYHVRIIEDGKVDFFANGSVHPYFALNPEIGVYTSGLYFHISPALTTSFVVASEDVIRKVESMFKLTYWSSSQLLLETSTSLISSGKADIIIEERKKLLRNRNRILNETFGIQTPQNDPLTSVIRWLKIPSSWLSAELTQAAFEQGILVRNSDIFALGTSLKLPYIRICNAAIHKDESFQKALIELKAIFNERLVEF